MGLGFDTKSLVVVGLSIALLGAMGLHSVMYDHHHPEAFFGSDVISAALHGEHRKFWTIVIGFIAVAIFCAFRSEKTAWTNTILFRPFFTLQRSFLYHPLERALRKGTLHPKLCAR